MLFVGASRIRSLTSEVTLLSIIVEALLTGGCFGHPTGCQETLGTTLTAHTRYGRRVQVLTAPDFRAQGQGERKFIEWDVFKSHTGVDMG